MGCDTAALLHSCVGAVAGHGVDWIHVLLVLHVGIDVGEQKIAARRQIGEFDQFGVVVFELLLLLLITNNNVIVLLLVLLLLQRRCLQLADDRLRLLVGVLIGGGDGAGSGGCGAGAGADGMLNRLRRAGQVLVVVLLDGGGRS